jgi:site-specific DNA-methyltransferase (adenine-specific)
LEGAILKLIKGECITEMHKIKSESIDLVICDLPYGTTESDWDTIIDPKILFNEYIRILKPLGTILLFGSEPFSTSLRNAAMDLYKYDWIWIKNTSAGFIHAKNKPLKKHEIISVFSKGTTVHENQSKNRMIYNPQGLIPLGKSKEVFDGRKYITAKDTTTNQADNTRIYTQEYENYPTSILKFNLKDERIHPTQKPVELYEYLINTYSNSGDVILDNCAGSGTLGAAGLNIPDREYIMIELEPKYQDLIIKRLPDIEVIEGSQEIYKPVLTVDRIIELANISKNGIEFNKMVNDEELDASKLLKEYKVKSMPQLRIKLRKL